MFPGKDDGLSVSSLLLPIQDLVPYRPFFWYIVVEAENQIGVRKYILAADGL